jgi:hypothetical protein
MFEQNRNASTALHTGTLVSVQLQILVAIANMGICPTAAIMRKLTNFMIAGYTPFDGHWSVYITEKSQRK